MEVKFDKISDTTGKVEVKISPADYADKIKSELKKIGANSSIPGFRKGHVDMSYLIRRFGKEVKADVINHIVADAALDYLKDNKIDILAQPLPIDVPLEINNDPVDYNFSYEVALAPELDIKLDKNVKLPYYKVDVTDQMVNEQDTMLRERMGAQVPGEEADEKALIKGSLFELDENGRVKETEDAIQVVDGIVAPMFFKDKEEAQKFLHCHVGDEIVFNPWKTCDGNQAEMSSMLHVEDKEKAAQIKSDFKMAVAEIIVLKPAELGEEFYKQVFGPDAKIESEEMYRKALKSMVEAQYMPSQETIFQNLTHKYLIDTYAKDLTLPEDFLKRWIKLTNPELTDEHLDEDFSKILSDAKWQLIRQEIEEKLQVSPTEEDFIGYATHLARRQFAQYGMTNYTEDVYRDFAKRMLADKDTRKRITNQVALMVLFNAIKNAVTLDVQTVSLEEFQNIGKKSEED